MNCQVIAIVVASVSTTLCFCTLAFLYFYLGTQQLPLPPNYHLGAAPRRAYPLQTFTFTPPSLEVDHGGALLLLAFLFLYFCRQKYTIINNTHYHQKCILFVAQRVGHHHTGDRNNTTIASIVGDGISVVTAVWSHDESDTADDGTWDIDPSSFGGKFNSVLAHLVRSNRGAFAEHAKLQSLVDAMAMFPSATASQLAAFFGNEGDKPSQSQRQAAATGRFRVIDKTTLAMPIMSPGCNAHRNAPHLIALAATGAA